MYLPLGNFVTMLMVPRRRWVVEVKGLEVTVELPKPEEARKRVGTERIREEKIAGGGERRVVAAIIVGRSTAGERRHSTVASVVYPCASPSWYFIGPVVKWASNKLRPK